MSTAEYADIAREFVHSLRNNSDVLNAWNELSKNADAVAAFVTRVSGVEVRPSDLHGMKVAFDAMLCEDSDVTIGDDRLPRAVGFAYAMADDRMPHAVGMGYAMVDDRLPRAVGFAYAMQSEPAEV